MRLIYVDESARDTRYYFFGALIVDADAVRSIERGFNEIGMLLARNVPGFAATTEFHATDMFHGREAWASVPTPWRVKACDLAAKVIARSSSRYIFRGTDIGCLHERYGTHAFAPHLLTLAHLLEDVDRRIPWSDDADQLGLVLADDHHSAPNARRSLRDFKLASVPGYTNRPLTHIADTIYFGPSHASRLLRAADVATFFLNRHMTVTERDPRSEKAMRKIVDNVRSVTAHEYVWCP